MTASQNPHHVAEVGRQRLRFAAAHMATFGGRIEPLHGHNYAAIIRVEGKLGTEGWVVDFGVLKKLGREICDRLDHHFLLQRNSTTLSMARLGDSWEIVFAEKRFLFPVSDVFELPVINTTAEQIAQWFWNEVVSGLPREGVTAVQHLSIGIEEAPGQTGWFAADVV